MMRWDTIVVAVIAAIPSAYAAWLGRHNSSKIAEVHLLINSRMSELMTAAKVGAYAEGQQKERDDQERRGKENA